MPLNFDCLYLAHALQALRLGELDQSTAIPGLSREQVYRQSRRFFQNGLRAAKSRKAA